MLAPKPIKHEPDYQAALDRVDQLMVLDPEPDSAEGQELETWAILIEDYERRRFPPSVPDPVEALRFVMDQRGLKPRDLAPVLGGRARVSEILSGRRALTLEMRQSLHVKYGIPATIMLRAETALPADASPPLDRYPIGEIARRGWLGLPARAPRQAVLKAMREFLAPLDEAPIRALTRRTSTARALHAGSPYALTAWIARVVSLARGTPARRPYVRGAITDDVIVSLVRLSRSEDGPRDAVGFLSSLGVCVVIAPHLPKTHLDGAVFFLRPEAPVIGLTLRHDRVDNFWFTLLHEIGHLVNDFDDEGEAFFDDLDALPHDDPREVAANLFAERALIPPDAWGNSLVRERPISENVEALAHELRIHPAIVAGRAQREHHNYRVLRSFVRTGAVRRLFAEATTA